MIQLKYILSAYCYSSILSSHSQTILDRNYSTEYRLLTKERLFAGYIIVLCLCVSSYGCAVGSRMSDRCSSCARTSREVLRDLSADSLRSRSTLPSTTSSYMDWFVAG